jgi:prepilin-type processing-associated H-X9-DG protein
MYGGVQFSSVNGEPFLDDARPLCRLLHHGVKPEHFACPSDRGITGPISGVGTAERSAFESFGTSYRANAPLVDARLAGFEGASRGLRRTELRTPPASMLIMGDPIWYEIRTQTGRTANWHGDAHRGNLLFLDGSVSFEKIEPLPQRPGLVIYEPQVVGPMGMEGTGGDD